MIWWGRRLNKRRVDGQQRIEEVGQADAVGFRKQTEERRRRRRNSRAACLSDFKVRLTVAVEQLVAEPSGAVLVGNLDGNGPDPAHVADRDDAFGEDAFHGSTADDFFKLGHGDISAIRTICTSTSFSR